MCELKRLDLYPDKPNCGLHLSVLWRHNSTDGSSQGCLFVLSEAKSKLAPKLGDSQFKKIAANQKSELWGQIQKLKGPALTKLVQAGVVKGGGTSAINCVTLQGLHFFLNLVPEAKRLPAIDIVGRTWGEHIAQMLARSLAEWERIKIYECDGISAPELSNSQQSNPAPTNSDPTSSSSRCIDRSKYTLDKNLISPALQRELEECKDFWTNGIVPLRKHPNVRVEMSSYMENKHGWFLRFLGFVHKHKPNLTLSLSLFLDVSLFEEFMAFLAQRSDKSEVGGHLLGICATAAVAACKFLTKNRSKQRNFRDIEVISDKYDGLISNANYKKNVLDAQGEGHNRKGWTTLTVLRKAWADLKKIISSKPLKGNAKHIAKLHRAREFQKFVVMTVWLGVPPVRSAVIRTIQITDGPKPHCNCLYWDATRGTYCVFAPKHKGPGKVNYKPPVTIALPKELFVPILSEFIKDHRPLLLQQQKTAEGAIMVPHGHLILSTRGCPYTKTNFSQYAKTQLWEKYTQVPMPAHLLRHIVVTDLGT
jgi:hypothetical protein